METFSLFTSTITSLVIVDRIVGFVRTKGVLRLLRHFQKKQKLKVGFISYLKVKISQLLTFYLCHQVSLLALVTILAQSLFTLVSRHFVTLLLLSVRHNCVVF